jgi:hypothetical protein
MNGNRAERRPRQLTKKSTGHKACVEETVVVGTLKPLKRWFNQVDRRSFRDNLVGLIVEEDLFEEPPRKPPLGSATITLTGVYFYPGHRKGA